MPMKRRSKNEPSRQITIRLSDNVFRLMDQYAQDHYKSMSVSIEEIMLRGFQMYEKEYALKQAADPA